MKMTIVILNQHVMVDGRKPHADDVVAFENIQNAHLASAQHSKVIAIAHAFGKQSSFAIRFCIIRGSTDVFAVESPQYRGGC